MLGAFTTVRLDVDGSAASAPTIETTACLEILHAHHGNRKRPQPRPRAPRHIHQGVAMRGGGRCTVTLSMLIADDAADVAEVVAFGARMEWADCDVTIVAAGDLALAAFDEQLPDIVLLDVELPPWDGFEVCRRIREVSNVPILMLSVRRSMADKVRALDIGADDYVTKPYEPDELFARIRALLRRAADPRPPGVPSPIANGDLFLDPAAHEVRLRGERLSLTSTEYRLLEELVRHAGTVVPHRTLMERAWGPAYVHDVHYLKVVIRRLRQELVDDEEHPRYIQTDWGTGYRFIPSADAPRG